MTDMWKALAMENKGSIPKTQATWQGAIHKYMDAYYILFC